MSLILYKTDGASLGHQNLGSPGSGWARVLSSLRMMSFGIWLTLTILTGDWCTLSPERGYIRRVGS